jgi:DNA-binding CsgD family transcriptional regulator
VFDKSLVPMVIVDNERHYRAGNAAARLLFRLQLDELLRRRIDDLTPPHMMSTLHERWAQLMREGTVAGTYDVEFPDGSGVKVIYCALANVLPAQHLIVFSPADWPGDELAAGDEETQPRTAKGALSPREREVLTLIAAGADLEQIGEDLTISVTTVRTHARNALRKLGARNRAHAIALSMQQGLIDLPPERTEDPSSSG